jgi:hypothetical protein
VAKIVNARTTAMPIEPLRGPQSDALADGREVIASGTIVGTPPIVRHEEGLRTAAQKPAAGFCLDAHDLVLSKYVAGREKDIVFNQALVRYGCVSKKTLLKLAKTLPVDDEMKGTVALAKNRPNRGEKYQ